MANTNDKKPHRGLSRRDFLAVASSTAALGALGFSSEASENYHSQASAKRIPEFRGKHQNILILMCDEMRYPPPYETDQARSFRQQYLQTQNALRAHGMEFQRHYAASVACAPSRTSIYTGQYPSLHGVTQTTGAAKEAFDPDVFWLEPNSAPTIGHYFRAGGYATFWKGKWHASDANLIIPGTHNQLLSFDANTGVPDPETESLYLEADQLGRYGFSGWIGPEPHGRLPLNSGSSAADTTVDGRDIGFASQAKRLIEQLDRNRSNRPWLIVASFVNPHDITLYGLAAALSGRFDFHLQEDIVPVNLLEPMPAGPTHSESLLSKPSCQLSYRDAYHSVFEPILFDERYVRIYYQLQKNVDEQMMRVYQALQSSRFYKNTVVLFTSDHGDLLGAHGDMHQKWYTAYEEAIHVPLIISNPRLFPEPKSVDTLTSHIDLLPTLLGLAGLDAERLRKKISSDFSDAEPLVGRNLAPLVRGSVRPDSVNEPLYFMTDDDPSRGLNQDNWTGIPYDSVIQPNHIETVIARLNGKVWKYSRYFDNPQFWSTPGDPDANPPPDPPPEDVVVRPPETAPPTTEGIYEIEYTVTVKTQPLPDEFEMYNVTDDPTEQDNLYGMGYPEQALLEALLVEQCEKKRLQPVSGTVPGQPSC